MRLKFALCASVALFILPLLLVTGSRAGLVLGVIGLLAGALLYRHPRRHQPKAWASRQFRLQYVIGGAAVLGLGGVTALLSRAEAIDRLLMKDETEELRLQLLQPIWEIIAIGRASCRARVCPYVEILMGVGALKKTDQ